MFEEMGPIWNMDRDGIPQPGQEGKDGGDEAGETDG